MIQSLYYSKTNYVKKVNWYGAGYKKIMISSESLIFLKVHGQDKCLHAPNVTRWEGQYVLKQMFC